MCIAFLIINILYQSGTFIMSDEPTWINHNNSKSIIYIGVHA